MSTPKIDEFWFLSFGTLRCSTILRVPDSEGPHDSKLRHWGSVGAPHASWPLNKFASRSMFLLGRLFDACEIDWDGPGVDAGLGGVFRDLEPALDR